MKFRTFIFTGTETDIVFEGMRMLQAVLKPEEPVFKWEKKA